MSAISAIKPAIKNFTGKPLSVASKVLGAATVASVIYDAHVNGVENATATDDVSTAYRNLNQFRQYKTMEEKSATTAKLKKIWYNAQQSFPFYHIASKTKGYGQEFGQTVINNLPLLALSAVALKFKTAGKVAGTLLAANGIKNLLYDVIGIGNKKHYNKY